MIWYVYTYTLVMVVVVVNSAAIAALGFLLSKSSVCILGRGKSPRRFFVKSQTHLSDIWNHFYSNKCVPFWWLSFCPCSGKTIITSLCSLRKICKRKREHHRWFSYAFFKVKFLSIIKKILKKTKQMTVVCHGPRRRLCGGWLKISQSSSLNPDFVSFQQRFAGRSSAH